MRKSPEATTVQTAESRPAAERDLSLRPPGDAAPHHAESPTAQRLRDNPRMVAQRARMSAAFGLAKTPATSHPDDPVVQRVLGSAHPIAAAQVATVSKPAAGKPVFLLDGPNGAVVVKVEKPGEEERVDFQHRAAATRELAPLALVNLPGSMPLTAGDIAGINALDPALAGAAAGELQQLLAQVGHAGGPYEHAVAVKNDRVEVGRNLLDLKRDAVGATRLKTGVAAEDLFENAPARGRVKLKKGNPQAQAALTRILAQPAVWTALGHMATFDLVMGNQDRFIPDGTVNLENLDFSRGNVFQPETALPLDNLSVQFPLAEGGWEGSVHLTGQASMLAYAQGIMTYIFQEVGQEPEIPNCAALFSAGMLAAATALKGYEAVLHGRANALVGDLRARRTAHILYTRLTAVGLN